MPHGSSQGSPANGNVGWFAANWTEFSEGQFQGCRGRRNSEAAQGSEGSDKRLGDVNVFKNRRSGQAVVEVALMMPWLAFLFVGVLDFGFYSYAAICTQNAARAAAMATSAGTTSQTNLIACTAALRELKGLPNMMGIAAPCPTDSSTVDDTHPVAA